MCGYVTTICGGLECGSRGPSRLETLPFRTGPVSIRVPRRERESASVLLAIPSPHPYDEFRDQGDGIPTTESYFNKAGKKNPRGIRIRLEHGNIYIFFLFGCYQ